MFDVSLELGVWSLEPFWSFLPSSIIPRIAALPPIEGSPARQDGLRKEPDILPRRVEMHLPRRRHQGMMMQDHDPFPRLPRPAFQTPAQINFLSGKQLVAESPRLPERRGLAENK